MGYGLVAVPRQLWRTADIKGAEKASFHRAGLQADRAIAAKKCATAQTTLPLLRPQHACLRVQLSGMALGMELAVCKHWLHLSTGIAALQSMLLYFLA